MRVLLLLLACLVMRPNIASAHPGGLNSSGCHNDRKRGGYHCHRSTYSPPRAPRAAPKPKPAAAPVRKTASMRASAKRSAKAKNDFRRANPCPVTGRASGSCPGWEVDHVVPLACGGPDTPSNMQWLTAKENRRKGAMGCKRRPDVGRTPRSVPASSSDAVSDSSPSASGTLAAMTEWRDRMCECADAACAQSVSDQMQAWAKAELEKKPPVRMTEHDTARARALGEEMGVCMQTILSSITPERLDRAMISTGIAAVKDRIVECGANSNAKGKVKLKVSVTSEGVPSNVEVIESVGMGLGECVAAAVRGATFAKTQLGGSFSYPFVF